MNRKTLLAEDEQSMQSEDLEEQNTGPQQKNKLLSKEEPNTVGKEKKIMHCRKIRKSKTLSAEAEEEQNAVSIPSWTTVIQA